MYLSVFLYIDIEMFVSHFNYTNKNCIKGIGLLNRQKKRKKKTMKENNKF